MATPTPSIQSLQAEIRRLRAALASGRPADVEDEPDPTVRSVACERFQALFENLPSGVAVYEAVDEGRDFRFVDINRAALQIAGLTRREVVGRTVLERFPAVTETGMLETLAAVWRDGQARSLPPHAYRDGRLDIWTEDYVFRLPEGHVMQIHRDVGSAIHTQQALEHSETLYRTLVESAAEEICVLDGEGRFLFANGKIAAYFDIPPESLVGRTLWDFFPAVIADGKMAVVREVLASGQGCTRVLPSEIDGEAQWYEATTVPLRREGARVTSVMVVARNVTELRRTQEELQAYRERMTKAERLASAGVLSAMVAHELAQPLTVIRLSLQNLLVQTEDPCPDPWRPDLTDCLREVDRVEDLIRRFRYFARTRPDDTAVSVAVAPVVARTLRLLDALRSQRGVTIVTQGLDPETTVWAREADIEQLCYILIENGLHAADPERARTLTLFTAPAGEGLSLCFADDCGGVGVEPAERVFEPFFTTKSHLGGSGLGLCVAQRIAREAGGRLELVNRPGVGATFRVHLPTRAPS